MSSVLDQNLFFVKEHVGMFKATNHYDILEPATGELLLECREDIGLITKIFRFTDYRRCTPFNIRLQEPGGKPLVRVTRGVSLILSKVKVLDENGMVLGGFKQKFFSVGGAFTVLDDQDQPVCRLQGQWTGWDFQFTNLHGKQLARVTKKWAGLGKELFTSADNYILQIQDDVPPGHVVRPLIFAAVMCIDMVLKE